MLGWDIKLEVKGFRIELSLKQNYDSFHVSAVYLELPCVSH